MKATHFPSAGEFRRWLDQHHSRAAEILVGFHYKASRRGGLTYAEALDEALCFGWIDGIRRRADATSYTIRFTPRKSGSIWSLVNVRHFQRLAEQGRIHAKGRAAFERRDPKRTGVYSFENRPQKFPRATEKVFRENKKAWEFWQRQPPGYQRILIWWVISAKQEATRHRRLAILIAKSAAGERMR